MKIKLSDYILEQSISTASIDDIEYERIKAALNVATAIAESYVKEYNMGLFQEVTAQPAQAQDNPMQKVQDNQASNSAYVQHNDEYEQNFQNAFNAIFGNDSTQVDNVVVGNYTATDGEDYYITLSRFQDNPDKIELKVYRGEPEANYPMRMVSLSRDKVVENKFTKDNMEKLLKSDAECQVAYRNGNSKKSKQLDETFKDIYREIKGTDKVIRDINRQNMEGMNRNYSPNADPNGTAVKNGIKKGIASASYTVFWLISLIAEIIKSAMGLRRRRKYTKHIKGLRQGMQSANIYLKGILSTCVNNPNAFNETEFSTFVAEYNRMLNQAIQVLNQPESSQYTQFEAPAWSSAAEKHGQDALQKAIESDMLFENDTLIKAIEKNRGIIEKRLSQLDEKSIVAIIESTKRYQQVLVPSLDTVKAEIKRIESEEANIQKMDQMVQNQPAPNPAPQTQQPQPPQKQQKKPGELDAGNGMMMMQPPQG